MTTSTLEGQLCYLSSASPISSLYDTIKKNNNTNTMTAI